MNKIRTWLAELQWRWIVLLAIFAGLAPWPMEPIPHSFQKIGFLLEGTLYQPKDIFDLVFHLSPTLLLIAKAVAGRQTTET